MKNNPLLRNSELPSFSQVMPDMIEPALDYILDNNRRTISSLLSQEVHTWENLLAPYEDLEEKLHFMWSITSHLQAVVNSKAIREVYNTCLPKLSAYSTEVGQNVDFYNAIQSIAKSEEYHYLDPAQKKIVQNNLRDFRLSGVHLNEKDKQQYAELQEQLATLTTKFEENLLDATQGWTHLVTDEKFLKGLPSHAILSAKEAADKKQLTGWLFTLEFPSYYAVMNYADSQELRRIIYTAYATRSSDQGPNAGQWDNSEVMRDILSARKKLASLLGYSNYAEFSLATKMAKETSEVLAFLEELVDASINKAELEYQELEEFAKSELKLQELMPWDIAYASEKLRRKLYDFSEEDLRPYFPENQVLVGLFDIVNKLYGITCKEVNGIDTWHKDVRFFEVFDENGELRGQFYLDLYARENKRGGAWMDDCRTRRVKDNNTTTPIVFLTCNFNRPLEGQPALFTHEEVLTLFHEFGHGLHHLLSRVNYLDVSGINGVAWDAVELPSQFMENWCWEKPALDLISRHYQTGEKLPEAVIEKMRNAKNFQSAMFTVRQLEFALFDFRLHMEFDEKKLNQIQEILDEVREQVSVIPVADFNRFQHGFSHIFAGGYAAGYYSYKWAEVLSSDAYSKFEETGIFNRKTGQEFLKNILEKGGSEDALQLFIAFRGRKPSIKPLLRHTGIHSDSSPTVEIIKE